MAKLVCAKPHFGAGGVKIPAGTEIESDAKADGVYWVEAEGDKKLEVATPNAGKPKTVKGLEAEIAVMTDLDALAELSQDERVGVQKAVEARLLELEAGE